MSKRGNQAYRARVDERFRGFEALIEQDARIDARRSTTNTVFATFTFDRALVDDVETAWQTIGHCLDGMTRKLRGSFGEVDSLRVWQAHQDGYPHVHAILSFRFASFRTFLHRGKIRVEDKVKERFEEAWPYGFVDVEVPGSVQAVKTHILRYVQRGMMVDEPTSDRQTPWDRFNDSLGRNVATLTLFRKRSFGFSRGWSTRLKALQAEPERLDTNPCITRFLPLQNVRLVGFSSMREARRIAKEPTTEEQARNHGFELTTLPLDLVERPLAVPTSEESHLLLTRGCPLAKPNSLEPFMEEYADLYDELSAERRRRVESLWKRRD